MPRKSTVSSSTTPSHLFYSEMAHHYFLSVCIWFESAFLIYLFIFIFQRELEKVKKRRLERERELEERDRERVRLLGQIKDTCV